MGNGLKRLTLQDALRLYNTLDLHTLGLMATGMRNFHNNANTVTYAVDRNINYTNICVCRCRFCAFSRDEDSRDAYVLSKDTLVEKIRATKEKGGTHVLLQGGLNPKLPFSYHIETVRLIREWGLHVHGYSPSEIIFFARTYEMSVDEILAQLKAAGLGSIPGGGAEILRDSIRRHLSPKKAKTKEYLLVMEKAHRLGIKTTATMMFGHVETVIQRLVHLKLIRDLQDKTGGFTAFILWPYQPWQNDLPYRKTQAVEYLRMLAISRLYLDNIPHIQASWVTQGKDVAQLALYFGADDMGSTMMEENVVSAAGTKFMLDEASIRDLIYSSGFVPKKRDVLYNILEN